MPRVVAHLLGSFLAGAATFGGSVFAFLLLVMMDGGARSANPTGLESAVIDDGRVIVYRRAPVPAHGLAPARSLSAAAAALLGREESEVVARLGVPSRQQLASPGKILHYDRRDCTVEVHLFPDYRRGKLYALDVLDTGGRHECLG